MSMTYCLAKITPELLSTVRAQPELARTLLLDDGPPLPSFDRSGDTLSDDWRTLGEVTEAYAAARGRPGEFKSLGTWLYMAVDGAEGEQLGFSLTYGPAWALGPERVVDVAEGLQAEWAAAAAVTAATAEGDEDSALYAYFARIVERMATFYRAAASGRRAIVGGIT
jgi:hypothetical protein